MYGVALGSDFVSSLANWVLILVVGDVGGQKTLRTYWKNYFEKTDTLIWVVDSTDKERIDDCRAELAGLLQEEVCAMHMYRGQCWTVSTALDGSEFTRLQEQERCKWVNDWAGYSQGWHEPNSFPMEGLQVADIWGQGLKLDAIKTHKWKIMSCSAVTGENLTEGIQWVVQDAKDRLFLYWWRFLAGVRCCGDAQLEIRFDPFWIIYL